MDLKIKDVAQLLGVSEPTIRRWIAEEKIPAYRLNHQYRFSRMEIENWLLRCRLGARDSQEQPSLSSCSTEAVTTRLGTQRFCLYRAVHQGDVLGDCAGETKEDVMRWATRMIAPHLHVDAEVLTELLLDREALMSTGLSQGVAVPHTREFTNKGSIDRIFVVYPQRPIPYGSLDGQDVHTLFFLFAGRDREHLQLLAKLAHLVSQPGIPDVLKSRPSKKALLEWVRFWEDGVLPSAASAPTEALTT